ncbi:MAG: tRNA pseudouridine(38-40) synthase TruA [Acidobacteriota bacterium]|nr:tRNA pseudouridine(38-40) synthase TruA [Acidobacteriota bacterium]
MGIESPRTLKLTLAYDGSAYAGWQRQTNGVSVQQRLEEALARLEGSPVTAAAAGRTDAGVHATGQVASVRLARDMPLDALARAVNAILPPDIRLLDVAEVPDEFHARFAARAKTYQYRLLDGGVVSPFDRSWVWAVPGPLDLEAMRTAARALEGRHDFASFQAAGSAVRDTVRTVLASSVGDRPGPAEEAGVIPRTPACGWLHASTGRLLVYEITGDGFLRHMVRAIVGTLVEIGSGRRPVGWMAEVLAARDRGQAGPTAPAQGLCLVRVDYDPIVLADRG